MSSDHTPIAIDPDEAREFVEAVRLYQTTREQYDAVKSSLEASEEAVAAFFPGQRQEDFGVPLCASVTDENGQEVSVICTRPIVEEWSDDALRTQVETLSGTPGLSETVAVTYKIDKRKLRRLPPEAQAALLKCKTDSPYKKDGTLRKPSLKIGG